MKIIKIIIIVLIINTINGCKTGNELDNSNLTNLSKFKVNNLTVEFDFTYNSTTKLVLSKTETSKIIRWNLAKTNNINLKNILESFKPNLISEEAIDSIQPIYLVFYLTPNFNVVTTDSINLNYITGFSIFYNHNNFSKHKLFKKNLNNTYSEKTILSKTFYKNVLKHNLLYSLSNYVDTNNKSYLIIKSNQNALYNNKNTTTTVGKSSKINFDPNSINKVLFDNTSNIPPQGGGGGGGICGSYYCSGPGTLMCGPEPEPGGLLACIFPTDCYEESTLLPAISETNTYNPYSLEMPYHFRDSFLQNRINGQKYIDYYYKISYVLNSTETTIIDKTGFAQFGIVVFKCAFTLLYGSDDAIVFNSDDKNLFNTWLNEFKNVTSNAEYQSILTDISNDINMFENKSVNYIKTNF